MTLDQASCIITGAARGIGLALCRALYARGANLVMTDLDSAALTQAAAEFDAERVKAVGADVRLPAELDSIARQAQDRWGSVDVWINNAGLARHRAIVDYTEEDLDLMMAVNLKGTILGCQSALRSMIPQRSGHIINIISTAALRGVPQESVYCAAKWGVRGFTQALQEEAAPHGIRVTAIFPGGVDTAFWDDAVARPMPTADFLTAQHVAVSVVSVLEQDDPVVFRELVVRSLKDRDFAQIEPS